MTPDILLTLLVLLAAIALFATEKLPVDMVAMLVLASVLVLGLAAVGMYLLVLRAEAFLNHLWGVRA